MFWQCLRNELQAALDKATVQLAGEQQALRSMAAQGSLRDALVQSTAARASADATRLVEQLSSQLDARHAEAADLAARLASADALIERLKHRVKVGHPPPIAKFHSIPVPFPNLQLHVENIKQTSYDLKAEHANVKASLIATKPRSGFMLSLQKPRSMPVESTI